jgi:hypothetical protein
MTWKQTKCRMALDRAPARPAWNRLAGRILPEERKLQNDGAGMNLRTVCSWTR